MQHKALVHEGTCEPDGGGFIEIELTSNFTHPQACGACARQKAQHGQAAPQGLCTGNLRSG